MLCFESTGLGRPQVKNKNSHQPVNSGNLAGMNDKPPDFHILSAVGTHLPATSGSEACHGLVGLPGVAQLGPVRPPPKGQVKGGRDNRLCFLALDS